jgi:hypothetical protein
VRPAIGISKNVPGFEEDLRAFIEKYIGLWQNSTTAPPASATTYTAAAQRANERETCKLIDSMEGELRDYPGKKRDQAAWRERIFASLRRFGTQSCQVPDSHFDIIFSPEYFAATRAFAHEARAFDMGMETAALAQALRNVWVMNCLQLFLGRQPALSPSIFAYSMLYPYTDNYLDRLDVPISSKEKACRRLGLRLSGRTIDPGDAYESAVFRLVEMIEGEFPRAAFPEVYSSLLAIHAGQVRSLSQQQQSGPADEQRLLHISVAKGGSSVLANGWLVAGKLGRAQAESFFGFGVMLQLLDDLQDLPEDRAAGHWTLFTRAAASERLDRLTSQLWDFMSRVLNAMNCCAGPRAVELRDLIRRSSIMMMQRAMAENADLYSSAYAHRMEQFSPLSFAFLRDRGREARSRFEKIWPTLARRRKLRSIFDLMG